MRKWQQFIIPSHQVSTQHLPCSHPQTTTSSSFSSTLWRLSISLAQTVRYSTRYWGSDLHYIQEKLPITSYTMITSLVASVSKRSSWLSLYAPAETHLDNVHVLVHWFLLATTAICLYSILSWRKWNTLNTWIWNLHCKEIIWVL